MKPVFLDSAFLIALGAGDDQHHGAALRLAEKLQAEKTEMVTTRAVFLELGSGLSKYRHRQQACEIFDLFESDEHVSLVEMEPALVANARDLFCSRLDKEWSLTDCISFLVMKDREITDALTTDIHFEQAGFKELLLEKQ